MTEEKGWRELIADIQSIAAYQRAVRRLLREPIHRAQKVADGVSLHGFGESIRGLNTAIEAAGAAAKLLDHALLDLAYELKELGLAVAAEATRDPRRERATTTTEAVAN